MGTRPPLEYLASCSKVALEAFELSRLNETANLRKEVRQILNGWIESEVDARIARWILDSKQSQAEHRDRRSAAMKQPVPLKQLDLSFLPQGDAPTDHGEEIENADDAACEQLRQRGTNALPSGAARATAKQRDSAEVKTGAKLLEKHGGARHRDKPPPALASPAADSIAKPPFAQDEENALHDLEYFVRDRKKAPTAHARNAVAGGDSRLLDEMPRLAGRTAAQSPRDAAGGHAEVRVSISALAQVLPVAAAGRWSSATARLPTHRFRLIPRCRPALARLSRREVQSGAFCVMRVAPAS